MKKRRKRKKQIIFTIIILLIIAGGVLFYGYRQGWFEKPIEKVKTTHKKHLNIIDLDSNERPYAVMIDNVKEARPQYGIQKAYMLYEIIVEGGLTRMMAVFKDVDVDKIGPVRSSRHYFLDYAMENDAIYTHYGWSYIAEDDIKKLGINNLNGLDNPANMFFRDSTLHKAPHNAYTSTENIKKAVAKKEYRDTSSDYLNLNYSEKNINLNTKYTEEDENGNKESTAITATNIKIAYSKSVYSSYTYDSENKVYLKFANGKEHNDASTNEQLKVKNIIIVNDVKNTSVDSYGRQDLNNTGTGSGYYITNGYAIKITWQKSSRSSKTVYKDENGKKLQVNDGNTFIHIQPSEFSPEIS